MLTFQELKGLLQRHLPHWEELEPESFDAFIAPVDEKEAADNGVSVARWYGAFVDGRAS